MFPIAVLVRGSNIFGKGEGKDVDLFVPYVTDSSQIFRSAPVAPVVLVDGNLDYEGIEIGVLVSQLTAGDSKALLSIMAPGIIAHTHWYNNLRTIIQNYQSPAFADSLMGYIRSIVEIEAGPTDADYEKAAQFIQLGMGYFTSTALNFEVVEKPKDGFTSKWYTTAMKELTETIENAKVMTRPGNNPEETYKVFDHARFVQAINHWLVGTRAQVFKIEDQILK